MKTGEIKFTPKLRERYFGEFEETSNTNYQKVWDDDEKNSSHTKFAVESADDVIDRTTLLITELEDLYTNFAVLLVAHGDPLRILQTAFERISAAKHRSLPHLQTGEIRELILK